MTREDIKSIIDITKRNGGFYECSYIPSEDLTPEKCQGLYYGGGSKIVIDGDGFTTNHGERVIIDNPEECIDRISHILGDNIGAELHQTMKNLNWEYEELKYFDRDTGKFEIFLNEIKRLKRGNVISDIVS